MAIALPVGGDRGAMTLSPVRTFWRIGSLRCVLYTGDGTFELRLIDGDVTRRQEICRDSGDAYQKSIIWSRQTRHGA